MWGTSSISQCISNIWSLLSVVRVSHDVRPLNYLQIYSQDISSLISFEQNVPVWEDSALFHYVKSPHPKPIGDLIPWNVLTQTYRRARTLMYTHGDLTYWDIYVPVCGLSVYGVLYTAGFESSGLLCVLCLRMCGCYSLCGCISKWEFLICSCVFIKGIRSDLIVHPCPRM